MILSFPAIWPAKDGKKEGGEVVRRRETSLFLALGVLFLLPGSAQAYRQVIDLGILSDLYRYAHSVNNSGQCRPLKIFWL
jgi:hypothetical protein